MAREDGLTSWNSDDPTLHRLLWAPEPSQIPLMLWRPRPWETPAVGLTAALATRLYSSARHGQSSQGWGPKQGPLTWALHDGYELLTAGRRLQFGEEIARPNAKRSKPKAIRSESWETPPHPAYFLPFVAGVKASRVNSKGFATYCDVLLLLTTLDGGEAILHRLARDGAGNVPFEDRWAWRSRIHLPLEAWQCVEKAIRWPESPTESLFDRARAIRAALRPFGAWHP